jgi:hypothetical protein
VGHRDGLYLAALAGELRGALALVVSEVVDVQGAGLGHPESVEPQQADQRVIPGRPRLDGPEDIGELGAGETLSRGDRFNPGTAHVEHRVPVENAVDHAVAVEAGECVELAGNRRQSATRCFELSGDRAASSAR